MNYPTQIGAGEALDNFMAQRRLKPSGKSAAWEANQAAMAKAAMEAGLPSFQATNEDSASRLLLKDAIARAQGLGLNVPHFIGLPNEPEGDRAPTMDMESLVRALQVKESDSQIMPDALAKIAKERAYWQAQVAQGMTAKQWKLGTGEDDPVYK